MKIKKIVVDSLQEALELMRVNYGENAIVMSTKVIKKRSFVFFTKSKLEVTIGIPDKEDIKEPKFKESLKEENLYSEIEELKNTIKELSKHITSSPKVIEKEEKQNFIKNEEFSLRALNLATKLLSSGIDRDLVDKLLEDACGYDHSIERLDLKYEDDFRSLHEAFEKNVLIKSIEPQKDSINIIALVGPTGVGKTTTIAKLAYLYKQENFKVGVITLDSFRVGAVHQLASYINLLELPYRVADTPQKLRESIGELSSLDVILIDTAGRSQYDSIRINELKNYFERIPSMEIILVLSSNLDQRVIKDSIEKFSVLNPQSTIFTKLDETLYPGNIINVSIKNKLPISYVTTGQRVPYDIDKVSFEYLSNLILRGR